MFNNSVSVDGWTCYDNTNPPADAHGNVWILQELGGWHAGTDIRAEPFERFGTDGDFDGPVTRSSRTVEVSGTLVAPDGRTLLQGFDVLGAVLTGSIRRGTLVVDEQEQELTRQATVRLGGPTLVNRLSRRHADFSLSLYMADPNRYSVDEHNVTLTKASSGIGRIYDLAFDRTYGALGSDGRATIVNAGTAATYPVITFTGPCVNPKVIAGPDTLELMMTLTADDAVVIDCAARTVIINNASRRHFLSTASRFISFEAGLNTLYFSVGSGDGFCNVAWRDAWT